MPTTYQLSDVKGIGEKTAADLTTAGIASVEGLAAASIEDIESVPGFGPARATAVQAAAIALLNAPAVEEPAEPAPAKKKGSWLKRKWWVPVVAGLVLGVAFSGGDGDDSLDEGEPVVE